MPQNLVLPQGPFRAGLYAARVLAMAAAHEPAGVPQNKQQPRGLDKAIESLQRLAERGHFESQANRQELDGSDFDALHEHNFFQQLRNEPVAGGSSNVISRETEN